MKKAVCGILIENGKVLTVSRKYDHEKIGFPCGKVEENESFEETIIRECLEETGYHVEVADKNIFVGNVNEYEVSCFLLNKKSEDCEEISPEETGIVEFVEIERLFTSSPYKEYNIKALKHFGVI